MDARRAGDGKRPFGVIALTLLLLLTPCSPRPGSASCPPRAFYLNSQDVRRRFRADRAGVGRTAPDRIPVSR